MLDFSSVKFLASRMLGVLLTIKKKSESKKGGLALCAVREDLMKVFAVTNLDRRFAFFKDEATALARSRSMSLRDFILGALVHERARIQQTPLADDGPLSDEQIAWLREQFPDSVFDGEERLGPSLW